ncbi:MAG TPA: HTTM domain-containing protein [Polyangiaceae bacterium]|nr:HTTM domain-containing protein [Polyangiaceae bacterium]
MTHWLAGFEKRRLGCLRIGIGCLILLRTTPLLAGLDIPWLRSTDPLLGWPTGGFDLGFLPNSMIQALCVVRTIAAVLFTLGLGTRLAGLACGVSGLLVAAQYPLGFFFTIYLLYQAAILLACTDAASQLVLRPGKPAARVGGVWLLRAFLVSIYFWAGIYKLRADWLDGRTLVLFHQPSAIHGFLADLVFREAWAPALAAKAVAGFELCIGPLLLWSTSRRFALLAAYAFHVLLELSAHPDMLGWSMMVLLLCFVPGVGGESPK